MACWLVLAGDHMIWSHIDHISQRIHGAGIFTNPLTPKVIFQIIPISRCQYSSPMDPIYGYHSQEFQFRRNFRQNGPRMQSFAAVSQVMGGLFFGQSADRFGTRWALLTAHTAAMSGWAKADISWQGEGSQNLRQPFISWICSRCYPLTVARNHPFQNKVYIYNIYIYRFAAFST